MRKLVLSPEQPEFTFTLPLTALSNSGDAPAIALRRNFRNMARLVNVSWIAVGIEFDYLRAFYRTGTGFGALPFLIDLPTDGNAAVEHKAFFASPIKFSGQTGTLFNLTAQLYASPHNG